MTITFSQFTSWAIGSIGFGFLLLSLFAACRQVFPRSEHLEKMRGADPEAYAALLDKVNNLKDWLAFALVGAVLILLSGYADPQSLKALFQH